jgi:hypothetical protein
MNLLAIAKIFFLKAWQRHRHDMSWIRDVVPTGQIFHNHESKIETGEERHLCQPERDRPHPTGRCCGGRQLLSLIAICRWGDLVIKAGGAVYVIWCAPMQVVPRSHRNCTEEIPVLFNITELFVDPISYVITSASSPMHCNDVAPPRYKFGNKWFCSYSEWGKAMTPQCCLSMKSR